MLRGFNGSSQTVVFHELLRKDYKVYYYKTSNNLECDFLIKDDNRIIQLIQVISSLKNVKTKKRELNSFSKTIDELKLKNIKSIVIYEDNSSNVEYNNISIEILNIKEWMLNI